MIDPQSGERRTYRLPARVEAQRVRVEAVLLQEDLELLRPRIEAGDLVAEAERDPDAAVGRDLEAVRRDVRVGVGGDRLHDGEHAAERRVAARDVEGAPLAGARVEAVELVLGR